MPAASSPRGVCSTGFCPGDFRGWVETVAGPRPPGRRGLPGRELPRPVELPWLDPRALERADHRHQRDAVARPDARPLRRRFRRRREEADPRARTPRPDRRHPPPRGGRCGQARGLSRSARSACSSTAATPRSAAKPSCCPAASVASSSTWSRTAAAGCPKTQIFNAIYGIFDENIEENVVESHVSKLRKKLRAKLGYDPIESKRYLGYCLEDPAAAAPRRPVGWRAGRSRPPDAGGPGRLTGALPHPSSSPPILVPSRPKRRAPAEGGYDDGRAPQIRSPRADAAAPLTPPGANLHFRIVPRRSPARG